MDIDEANPSNGSIGTRLLHYRDAEDTQQMSSTVEKNGDIGLLEVKRIEIK